MAALSFTAKNVRPLDGAVVRDYNASEALTMGDVVFVDTTYANTSGVRSRVLKSVNSTSYGVGIVVATQNKTTTAAVGEAVSVVVWGPVAGFSGMTPGKRAYLSATAARLDDTGTKAFGEAHASDILFVRPDIATSSLA